MKKYRARHHNDIKRLLAQIRREGDAPPPDTGGVLDALNAFGHLEVIQQKPPGKLLCFGPRAFGCADGSAVLMWHKPTGIGMHRRLGLLGIWAVSDGAVIRVITGTRALTYGDIPFNIESYFYNLRRDFRTYYGSDTAPPDADGILHTAIYQPENRLDLRQIIQSTLQTWRTHMQSNAGYSQTSS